MENLLKINNGGNPEIFLKEDDLNLTEQEYERLANDLGIGEITLKDITKELKKPGRDPRDEMPQPILRKDILSMEDLEEGMILSGTVRNVVDFGAFVDIGVHQDGLVHISEISDRFKEYVVLSL